MPTLANLFWICVTLLAQVVVLGVVYLLIWSFVWCVQTIRFRRNAEKRGEFHER